MLSSLSNFEQTQVARSVDVTPLLIKCIDIYGYPRRLVLGKVPSPKCEKTFTKTEAATEADFSLVWLTKCKAYRRSSANPQSPTYAYTRG